MTKKVGSLLVIIVLLVIFIPFSALAENCTQLYDGLEFNASFNNKTVTACAGNYSASADTVFINITAEEFTLDCASVKINGAGNGTGILISSTSAVTISECSVSNFKTGIYADDVVGLYLSDLFISSSAVGVECSGVVRGKILQSNFKMNDVGAILFNGYVLDIEESTFENNSLGAQIIGTDGSMLRKNSFVTNDLGLKINSSNIAVYRNIFKSTKNALADDSTVSWDVSNEGNYWSDYSAALDTDADGIGNTPYFIESSGNGTGGQDNYPFVNETFSTAAKYKLEEREGEYAQVRNGHSISFGCGANISYSLVLTDAPTRTFALGDETFVLNEKKSIDLDKNGAPDVYLFLQKDNIESLDIKLALLGDCINYCGDGFCLAPETINSCELDCVEQDNDGDTFKASEGDCNDADALVYPGAEEVCVVGQDSDCDGLSGEEDPDCRGIGFGFWFFLFVLFLSAGGIIYLVFIKPRTSKAEEEEEEKISEPETHVLKPKKKVGGIGKIKRYAKQFFSQGYDPTQVKEMLVAQGWPMDKVEAAVDALADEV